ncbi:MAG: peptidylprolyl isomerase [Chitinophagales bacterium]|nr:peptidylprolyl isomerase [Chitinophagales bacterium]
MKKLLLLLPVLILVSFKPKEKRHTVEITTDYGVIKIMLYNETPQHRDNMLKLVNEHFYDSTLFHRVIKEFMIQGGDPESKHAAAGTMLGSGDVGYTIPAEFNAALFHKKGALAAARDNNPEKKSSGCQFYIVQGKKYADSDLDNIEKRAGIKYTPEQREVYKTVGGTPFLDQNYTVYGEVYEGLNIVDSIASVATAPGDRPLKDVRMYMKEGKKIKVK